MVRQALFIAGLLYCASNANAQVLQSGSVTAGHVPVWVANGVVGDAGPATNGKVTEFGIVKNGDLPFCISSHNTSNFNQQPYAQLCLSVSDSLAFLSLQGYGEATPPLEFIVNGVVYSFPFSGGGSTCNLRRVSTGTSDSATTSDNCWTVSWTSATTAPKTETLFACSTGSNGYKVTVVDEQGTAGTYPLVILPSGTNKIVQQASLVMNQNNQAATLQCDGTSNNWVQL